MDLIASFIGFIVMGGAILWFCEVIGTKEKEEAFSFGLCGCLFCFLSGASLSGTLKSVFAGNLDVFLLVFFLVTAFLSVLCFLVWKKS